MKICYIWVERFRNFENFGFNLSSSQKFKYDSKNNILSRIKIDPLPVNFFGERIEDVVGIIGKNGAGKSNAIELVCKILKGAKTSLQTDFLIIVEEDGNLYCYYSGSFMDVPKADFAIGSTQYNGNINPLKVVFFSNVFDERRNEFDKDVADISVNNLFFRNAFSKREKTSNFEKQIKFINTKFFRSLNIELPTKVQITSKVWTNRFNPSFEREIYGENYERIRDFKKSFRDRVRDIKPENKFIYLLRFGFFFEILHSYSRVNGYRVKEKSIPFENIGNVLANIERSRTTEEITEKLINYLDEQFYESSVVHMTLSREHSKEKTRDVIFENIRKQLDFLKNIKQTIGNIDIENISEGARNRGLEYFTFDYRDIKSNEFLYEYVSLFANSSSFDINWLGISSGHKAYLNLYASIYQELRYAKHNNLLLCIDEGYLYLHPMWQIEFFDKLISVLPKIFSGNIQIILTSHSPFLLSDLPKQNITILDQSIFGSSQDGIELTTNTFGGNLYDLYSKPFFLGEKRTSDFAYKKIKELIYSVEGKEILEKDKPALLKIANLVGDEIIQYRIKKLLKND